MKVICEDGNEESYKYRKDGLLTETKNKDAKVMIECDILGRVIRKTCNGETVESKYDIANNRTKITSSLGADIAAEYNMMGDIISLGSDGWQNGYDRDLFGLETARYMGGGLHTGTERYNRGRVTSYHIGKNNNILSKKSYLWGTNDRLLAIVSNGKKTQFEYDGWGNLSKTFFEDGRIEHRNPDRTSRQPAQRTMTRKKATSSMSINSLR
jgi:YD repeat-containing protein